MKQISESKQCSEKKNISVASNLYSIRSDLEEHPKVRTILHHFVYILGVV